MFGAPSGPNKGRVVGLAIGCFGELSSEFGELCFIERNMAVGHLQYYTTKPLPLQGIIDVLDDVPVPARCQDTWKIRCRAHTIYFTNAPMRVGGRGVRLLVPPPAPLGCPFVLCCQCCT